MRLRKTLVSKMEVDLIFKIAAVGLIVAVLNQVLQKSDKGEYAMLLTLSGVVIVILMIIPQIKDLFDTVREILEY